LFRDDDGIAFGLDSRVAYSPSHQGLTAMHQSFVSKLALRRLDRTRQLPALVNPNDGVLSRNAYFVQRIDDSADPVGIEGDGRVEAMTAALAAWPKPTKTKAGTLLALIEEYRGRSDRPGKPGKDPSPEWSLLAPATRRTYDRILDPETGYLRRATNLQLDQIALHSIDKPNVVRFRNRVAKQFGFWTGNYTVKVLRPLFEWGILYGHMKANPATGVPALERPDGTPVQHRSWAPHEFEVMLAGARERGWDGIVLALALARFAGWPLGDIVHQPPTTWQNPRLVYVRRKTRKRAKILASTRRTAPDS
jgi:hypothetical protein